MLGSKQEVLVRVRQMLVRFQQVAGDETAIWESQTYEAVHVMVLKSRDSLRFNAFSRPRLPTREPSSISIFVFIPTSENTAKESTKLSSDENVEMAL